MMHPNLIPLVYLVYREALSSVFASQVLTPLEEHREVARITLGLLTPVGHLLRGQYRPALRKITSRCQQAGIPLGWIPSPPTRTPWLWSDAFLLRQWISQRFRRDQSFIVRCRNAEMTCIALEALKSFGGARVLYDCRGAEVIEAIQRLGLENLPESEWNPVARRTVAEATQRESRAVTESAGVICVSHAMVRMLQQRYPEVPDDKFRVAPCCPDVESFRQVIPDRAVVRQELGLAKRFVVTYLGSLAWYQRPDASMRLFRLIQAVRPEAHFLAITTEPDKMRQLATQAGIAPDSMTIRSVPARDVPRLLVASDLGLLLRDDSETNRVASPVKFGEYLAAGVPVVITPRLGDCSAAVREHHLGVEVDLSLDDAPLTDQLRGHLAGSGAAACEDRDRCARYAETELSWTGVVPPLAQWYAELLNRPSLVLSTAPVMTGTI